MIEGGFKAVKRVLRGDLNAREGGETANLDVSLGRKMTTVRRGEVFGSRGKTERQRGGGKNQGTRRTGERKVHGDRNGERGRRDQVGEKRSKSP